MFTVSPLSFPVTDSLQVGELDINSIDIDTRFYSPSFTSHSPITIVGNDDFDDDGDWSGKGTESEPYVLEGFIIDSSVFGICISLTTSYFVIRNSVFVSSKTTGIGAKFDRVTHGTIENCTFLAVSKGAKMLKSTCLNFSDNNILDSETGLFLEKVKNSSVTHNTITNASIGIASLKSDQLFINNNSIDSKTEGILLDITTNSDVTDNVIYNSDNGIHLTGSYNCKINSTIVHSTKSGILVEGSDDCLMVGSEVHSSVFGVFISSLFNFQLLNNSIHDNNFGVYVAFSSSVQLLNNSINKNRYGVYLSSLNTGYLGWNAISQNTMDGVYSKSSKSINMTRNIINDNQGIGINLIGTAGCWIFDNELGWNTKDNAVDDQGSILTAGNNWDDGVRIGNAWSDFKGSGVYLISGQKDSVDKYPTTILSIDNPPDINLEFGDSGCITWTPKARSPQSYEVNRDGVNIESEAWSGNAIEVCISGLVPGSYVYVIVVYNQEGRSVSDSVKVSVIDSTSPTWDMLPEDQIVEFGERFSYGLSASDLSDIGRWWISDETNFTIDSNGLISDTSVLMIGSYYLEIRAYDIYDNFCSATIQIVVQDTVSPTLDQPGDIEYTFGDSGFIISWVPFDAAPMEYSILQNDIVLRNGRWNSSSEIIQVSVDNLPVGVFTFTLIVIDTGGNEASDDVIVIVNEVTPTTPTDPTTDTSTDTTTDTGTGGTTPGIDSTLFGNEMILIAGLGLICGVGVILILTILRRKGRF
jgi:parallel beta-helix repeat protein